MTKEELKQEAEEYARPWETSLAYVAVKDAYLAGAEPREKQIEQLTYLHNEDVNTIKLLNEQIKTLAQNLEDTEILNKTLTESIKFICKI